MENENTTAPVATGNAGCEQRACSRSSDTPETDALCKRYGAAPRKTVPADFARKLERERNAINPDLLEALENLLPIAVKLIDEGFDRGETDYPSGNISEVIRAQAAISKVQPRASSLRLETSGLNEDFFSDESIIEQSSAMVEVGGKITNGFALLVNCPQGMGAVEIVLEYEEMKAALADLDADREAMPHLYSGNDKGLAVGAPDSNS